MIFMIIMAADEEPTVEILSMEDLDRGKQLQTDVQMMMEVISKVEWKQTWLIGLMTFHLLTFIVILLLRKWTWFMGGVLVILGGLCFSSQYINQWCANHWKYFSSDQYFDSVGVFITIIFSLPLLLNCFVILVCLLIQTFTTMQQVAKMKIKKKEEFVKKVSTKKTD